jgi:putative phosphoribosyl transferase
MNGDLFFRDRFDAGRRLAAALMKYKGEKSVVFALTRGGVPVGKLVALALGCPIEPLVVKKIGYPGNPEYGVGAISDDGFMVLNTNETDYLDKSWLQNEIKTEQNAARKKRDFLMAGRESIDAKGRTAIIIDDGVATGLTILAAIKKVRAKNPQKVIVAVPVAPKDVAAKIEKEADEFVALNIPENFIGAVGAYYENFDQITDEQALEFLKQ